MDLGTLRQFFRYRRRFDPDGFIPGREWAPQAAKSDFVPYIFSIEQIRALLDEAARLRCSRRARTAMRVLILILYCTGLRFGEAIRLEIQDVDLHRHLFRIRESKGRTRWVPFRADLRGSYVNIENNVIRLPPLRLVLPFWFVQMVKRFPSRERRALSGACFVAWASSHTADGPAHGHTTCGTPMPFTA